MVIDDRWKLAINISFFCLMYTMLPGSQDCSFLISPSLYANVYFNGIDFIFGGLICNFQVPEGLA
jgi:hypothetical protein